MDDSRSHPDHTNEPGSLIVREGNDRRASSADQEQPTATAGKAKLAAVLSNIRYEAISLILIAVGLAAFAQYLFLKQREFSLAALACALLAIPSLVLARVLASPPTARDDSKWSKLARRLRPGAWRIVMVLAAAGLTSLNLTLLAGNPPLKNYNVTWLPWLGAIGLYLVAVHGRNSTGRAPVRARVAALWTSEARPLVLAVIAIFTVGLALRLLFLTSIPYTVGGDEGSQGLDGVRVLNGEITNPFGLGWLSVPTMAGYINAITIKLFGNSILGLRLIWSLIGSVTVLISFLLVRHLQGTTTALLAAGLLATYHYHIHYSRIGAAQIADPFFTSLALYFLYRAYEQGRRLDWALCGVITGVAQYSYAGARFAPMLVLAITVLLFLRAPRQFPREHGANVAIMLGALLMTAAPMIQVAIRFPNDYNARLNQVGIFQSGWLEREQAIRATGAIPILFDQIKRAVLAYNAYPDRVVWYGTPGPLFDFAWGALFLLGMGYGLLLLFDRKMFPMVAWWWGVMLLGGALTESPPSSQRLTGSIVPAVFFVALALVQIGRTLVAAIGQPRLKALAAPAVLIALVGLGSSSVTWYFKGYTPLGIYGGINGLVATELARYEREHFGTDDRVFFLGAPRMVYRGFSTLSYLAPQVEGVDLDDPLTAPLSREVVGTDKNAIFVLLPERLHELDLIRATFPNGRTQNFLSPFKQELLFTTYSVDREHLVRHER